MAEIAPASDKSERTTNAVNSSTFNLVDIAGSHRIEKPSQNVSAPHDAVTRRTDSLPPISATPDPLPNLDAAAKHPIITTRDVTQKYAVEDPSRWEVKPFADYYENGVIKLHSESGGKQLFGIRVASDDSERTRAPIGGPKYMGSKTSVSLEFKLKF